MKQSIQIKQFLVQKTQTINQNIMKPTTLTKLIALVPACLPCFTQAAAPTKPNIIFILADDLGLDGVSCYGADAHQTPQIDKLASSGTRFETCYAAPLCGPSRCALMTGRYAFRTGGIANGSWRAGGPGALSKDEQPVAKLMKQAGYATCESGKWRQVGETPKDWGFDEYCTDPTAGGWYWKDSFTDMTATFAELGGTKLPEGINYDSRSIAPQLRGGKGNPREWAYVQLGAKWFVREQGWKMNEANELFDMSDAPFVEKPIAAAADTDASKAARARLSAVLVELNPAGGKTDGKGGKAKRAKGNK